MAKVHVILLNWNGWRDTIQCLESVLRSQYPDFHVIVCDNNSTDSSMEKIRAWAEGRLTVEFDADEEINEELRNLVSPPFGKPIPYVEYGCSEAEKGGRPGDEKIPLVLIRNGENLGYSAGNNVGIRYAMMKNADYIWLLNNDTVIEHNALKELVYRMQSDDSIGLLGAVIYLAKKPSKIQAYGGGKILSVLGVDRFLHSPGKLLFISGTSMFIKRKVLEQIGLLDERFFFYWEDADFSRRTLIQGWKLGVASNATVYHKGSASVGEQSLKSDLFKVDSIIRYFSKHQKIRWVFPVTFNVAGMLVKRLFRRQFNRIGPIIKEAFKAAKHRG
jgi:GT2 family glycosyltransferase